MREDVPASRADAVHLEYCWNETYLYEQVEHEDFVHMKR